MALVLEMRNIVLLTILANGATFASLYDPHLFPEEGPFFEGWYMRVSVLNSGDSVGLLFGSVLPSSKENISGPLVLASILLKSCERGGRDNCKLVSVDGKFAVKDLNITVNGRPVTENPEKSTQPDFKWLVNNGHEGGSFEQKNGRTAFEFRLGDLVLRGEAQNPVQWNEYGTGPEGWLVNLPLPLHWFVYSLKSEVSFFEITNVTSGSIKRVYGGVAHLEKNWGKSFPRQWIWSEGVSSSGDNASFALSGGLVDFPFLSVNAYLIGYRNPAQRISLDFRPDNSVISTEIDGCTGTVVLSANSLLNMFEVTITAPNYTLSSCLFGPKSRGFVRTCVESYDATAHVRIWRRSFVPFGSTLVEQKTFDNIALQFGGLNVCGGKCSDNF